MRKRISIFHCIVILASLNLWGQQNDLYFSGDYDEVSFNDFMLDVKTQTGASFYYLADWVINLRISLSGENLSLRHTLDKYLPSVGLGYIILDADLIYITKEESFNSYIPYYFQEQSLSGLSSELEESGLSETFLGGNFWNPDADLIIEGIFNDIPFEDFAEEVHKQTGASIFYLTDWIRGIHIQTETYESSLRNILDNSISQAGLHYIIVDENQVYISNRTTFDYFIPDYAGLLTDLNESADSRAFDGLSYTARKYADGRKSMSLDTLVVGTREAGKETDKAVVFGKITDSDTGEPLIGATIYFNELKMGAATDLDGRYSIVVDPGKYTAEFKCMGMADKEYFLEVRSGANLSVSLQKSVVSLTEVVIQAHSYQNIRGTQMGVERLNYEVLKQVPVVMGEKDILRVVQMLPGVQSVGEGAAGFNVRGSAADQNMIYLNKIPVYNSSHLFGFFTSFNPDIVKDFTLYKSNLPVYYGGRLASVTNITARQGNMNKFAARGGISPVTGNLTIESPIVKDKCAILLAGRSSYSDWLLKQAEIPILNHSQAQFYDLAGALTCELSETTLVKAFGYTSKDQFSLGYTNDYNYSNTGGSLNIRQQFGSRLHLNLALIYSEYEFRNVEKQVVLQSYSHDYRISHHEVRADMSMLSVGRHSFTFGASGIYYDLNRGIIEPYGDTTLLVPRDLGVEQGVEVAAYLADEISVFKWLTIYGGFRYVNYKFLGPDEVMLYNENQPYEPWNVYDTLNINEGEVSRTYTSFEPRLAVNFLLGPYNSVKFSYNRIRQFLFMLTNTIAISPTDQWKLCDYHIKPPSVDQYAFGYYLNIPKGGFSTSVELYYKTLTNVLDYKDGASFIGTPHIETQVVPGNQVAYGIEGMIRKSAGKLSGWLAYSYARSFMQVLSPYPGESINKGDPFPSNYDRPHSFNLVSNIKLNRRISISSNVVYMTGRPVTYPISRFYMEELQFLKYSERNQYRLPDYFRIDLSLNIEGNLKRKKLFHSYWMLNFYNVTGRQNAYSVFFKSEGGIVNGYKLSIFGKMIATLSWNFKLGNYATE